MIFSLGSFSLWIRKLLDLFLYDISTLKLNSNALKAWWHGEGRHLYCVSWTCLVAPVGLAGWIRIVKAEIKKKSSQTWVWTGQVFLSLPVLTMSYMKQQIFCSWCLLNGKGWPETLWFARIVIPRIGQLWTKHFFESKFATIVAYWTPILWCHVSTQLCNAKIEGRYLFL